MKSKLKLISQSFMGTMMIAMFFTFTACKDSGSSGNTNTPPPPPAFGSLNCAGGVGGFCSAIASNPSALLTAQGKYDGVYTSINIVADVVSTGLITSVADPKAAIYYSGPAGLTGVLSLRSVDGTMAVGGISSLCNAPFGDYSLTTTQQGTMGFAILRNFTMRAVSQNGAYTMLIQASAATLYNSEDMNGVNRTSTTNRMYMQMQVLSVNGMSCGMFISIQ